LSADQSHGIERRLAAILSADLHGYSRMMADDDVATVRAITAARELIGEQVREHRGRVVDSPGDNLLAEFSSAVYAVRSAVAIQRELAARNAGLPPERRMEFRIGVHLGDVIVEDGRVYGDGVNIAARLEALAPPGGICISAAVQEQIRGKLDVACDDLGEQQVKNIARPVRVFRVKMEPSADGAAGPGRSWRRVALAAIGAGAVAVAIIVALAYQTRIVTAVRSRVPAAEATKATVAVLPFANLSASKDDEYFSDGMTDEIIGDLSKIAGLQVAGRTSSFALKGQSLDAHKVASLLGVRNLVEGSVRRAANKIRIEVQLTDAHSGFNLWSEKYDEDISDVFRIQSDVAERVAEKLQVRLLAGEQARVEKKPTQNVEAYNLYLQGRVYHYSNFFKAREYYNRAIDKDPNFAAAYVAVADTYGFLADIEMPSRDAIEKVEQLDRRALAIDSDSSAARESIANYVLCQYQWNWKAAEQEFELALKLDPSNADAYIWYAWSFGWTRRYGEALVQSQRAHELDPLSPFNLAALGDLYRESGQVDRALEYHRQVLDMAPDFWGGYFGRGLDLIDKGDMPHGLRDLEKVNALNGDPFAAAILAKYYGRAGRRGDAARILEHLKERSRHGFVSNFGFFSAYTGLGDMDRAFQYLEKAYEDRSVLMPFLSLRESDSLRSDPRFQATYKKVGLPP